MSDEDFAGSIFLSAFYLFFAIIFSLAAVGTIWYMIFPITFILLIWIYGLSNDNIDYYFKNRKTLKNNHNIYTSLHGIPQRMYVGVDCSQEMFGKSIDNLDCDHSDFFLNKRKGLWMIPVDKNCKVIELLMQQKQVIDFYDEKRYNSVNTIYANDYLYESLLK